MKFGLDPASLESLPRASSIDSSELKYILVGRWDISNVETEMRIGRKIGRERGRPNRQTPCFGKIGILATKACFAVVAAPQ